VSARLLFDQNLSPKLINQLSDLYADSAHLDALGLGTADDTDVWQYAKENDFLIVTKDADFADLSILRGFPPKIIWIRRGNCSTRDIEQILRGNNAKIENFLTDPISGILTLF
jgi:predicted nuclease of predicted toxin-antitoxin system